ncbi:MAG: class I SAM-dependent methyltransferase [Chitinophagales bacterium]|nr:class I SAM-dependent methyltransferase [Chitinophagales bacterium]MDW8419333.1 class I SAM-dependent methyltransferase [Chitinophagales bacterium]
MSDILLQGHQADVTVERLLRQNRKWGARDRQFVASTIYDIVRYKRLLEYLVNSEFSETNSHLFIGAKCWLANGYLPQEPQFAGLRESELSERLASVRQLPVIRESYPDWLYHLGQHELGDVWEEEAIALNNSARLCVRVNTLKCTKKELKEIFDAQQVTYSETELAPDALVLCERINLHNHPAYRKGFFEIQDVSSQLVAPFMQIRPGMAVADVCAGAGGKTLHLAALMQNQGIIVAADISMHKLEQLRVRASRSGASNIRIVSDTDSWLSENTGTFDALLIDAPCSGTGVLRRKPDAKWHLTEEFIHHITKVQLQLMERYTPLLREGGTLVYSTCSILPRENEMQVKKFLQRHPHFILDEERTISPAKTGFDGFYMARLKRKA